MTSFFALTECSTRPLYFFDQPTRRKRIKRTRSSILYFNVANEGEQLEQAIKSLDPDNGNKEGESDEPTQRLTGETCGDGKPDTSSAVGGALNMKNHDPMDAYKRAAPQLLNELARLLCQHKWTEEGCLPHGIVNILNYSWQDLTAGAAHLKSPRWTDRGRKLNKASRQVSADDEMEIGESNSSVGNIAPPERKTQHSSNPRMKKRKSNSSRAHTSTTISFSISSSSCKDPGWIIQPKQPSCDARQRMSLCQWVVQRLQAARNPQKLHTAEEDLNKPLILRHYGDTKEKLKDKRTRSKPSTLVNGMPQIPEAKQQDPARKKLHYRINDGSSFIYYPSGCMAVCQSHSGLPCRGLYTNVFSDSECPVILATITAFGCGSVTHPLSSAITAVWDQDGGFICDHCGNITKEWSWQTDRSPREKIVIHLSDLISVELLSGTSATLSFRCDDESVQLPLSALSNMNPSKEMTCLQTDGKFTSDTAQDLQTRNVKSPVVVIESMRNLTLTPDAFQMVREVEGLEEPSAQWRRGGHAGRDLKRLQQRARKALDDWLDYYRVAIGIKCPNTKRMPDAPLRTRLRREVQLATLPSLNPPRCADAEPVKQEESRSELQELHRETTAESPPAERPMDSSVKLPRTSKKRAKEESRVTQIGPLQIHGNIKLESVIIPNNPELSGLSVVTHCPAQSSFTPSIPLTVCPPLLRAAMLGEGGRRRCCCSTTVMPVVTDLEYDAFIMGQPPHSQQILVVCVTPQRQPINTHSAPHQDALEQLYRRRNKHRPMPCTQCQMDSFRLVRYEMSTGKSSCGVENILLQQRHNAAPGMILMYIRGKLLFVGYICSGHSCSVRDLQKQISRTRGDYRLGLCLPSDYKFSDTVNIPAATDAPISQDVTLTRVDTTLSALVEMEKANDIRNNQVPEASHQRQRDLSIKPKKTPAFPHVPVIMH